MNKKIKRFIAFCSVLAVATVSLVTVSMLPSQEAHTSNEVSQSASFNINNADDAKQKTEQNQQTTSFKNQQPQQVEINKNTEENASSVSHAELNVYGAQGTTASQSTNTSEPLAIKFYDEKKVWHGDVNGDKKINNRDLGMLQKILNNWDITYNAMSADVNGDGKINNRDLGMLQKHLNNWDVKLDKYSTYFEESDCSCYRNIKGTTYNGGIEILSADTWHNHSWNDNAISSQKCIKCGFLLEVTENGGRSFTYYCGKGGALTHKVVVSEECNGCHFYYQGDMFGNLETKCKNGKNHAISWDNYGIRTKENATNCSECDFKIVGENSENTYVEYRCAYNNTLHKQTICEQDNCTDCSRVEGNFLFGMVTVNCGGKAHSKTWNDYQGTTSNGTPTTNGCVCGLSVKVENAQTISYNTQVTISYNCQHNSNVRHTKVMNKDNHDCIRCYVTYGTSYAGYIITGAEKANETCIHYWDSSNMKATTNCSKCGTNIRYNEYGDVVLYKKCYFDNGKTHEEYLERNKDTALTPCTGCYSITGTFSNGSLKLNKNAHTHTWSNNYQTDICKTCGFKSMYYNSYRWSFVNCTKNIGAIHTATISETCNGCYDVVGDYHKGSIVYKDGTVYTKWPQEGITNHLPLYNYIVKELEDGTKYIAVPCTHNTYRSHEVRLQCEGCYGFSTTSSGFKIWLIGPDGEKYKEASWSFSSGESSSNSEMSQTGGQTPNSTVGSGEDSFSPSDTSHNSSGSGPSSSGENSSMEEPPQNSTLIEEEWVTVKDVDGVLTAFVQCQHHDKVHIFTMRD